MKDPILDNSSLTPSEEIETNVKYEISSQDLEVLRDIFG